jgi:pilus assembly protein Flp/PilA
MFNNALVSLWTRLQELRNESGQGMVEYALILVLVSVLAIVALRILGVDVDAVFDSVEGSVDGQTGS